MTSFIRTQKIFAVLIISGFIGCTSNAPEAGYEIKGTINGLNEGYVKLSKGNPDRTSTVVDSAEVKDGKFVLRGKVNSPEVMGLKFEPGNWSVSIFMENSDMALTADTTNADHFDYTSYGGDKGAVLKEYTLTGSQNHNLWMDYENAPALKKYDPVFNRLQEEYKAAADDKEKVNEVKDRMDSVRSLLVVLQKNWIDSFIVANPTAAAGAHLLNNYYMFNEDMPLKDMESMMAGFSGEARSTVYFRTLSDELQKRKALLPGNTAPDFTLLKPDSTSFTLSSLRGKYVLLDFWASWCVPCRKAIPHWKQVYNDYHDKGLEIVGVTNDVRWSDWFKALDEEKMPWLQVADEFPVKNMPARVGTLYMTPYLPTYILLDREGRIVLHNATKKEIDDKLKELL